MLPRLLGISLLCFHPDPLVYVPMIAFSFLQVHFGSSAELRVYLTLKSSLLFLHWPGIHAILFFILGGPKTIQVAQFGIPSMYRGQNIKEYDSVCWKANLSHLELRKRHINLSTASQPVCRLFPSYLLQRNSDPAFLRGPSFSILPHRDHLPLCELKTKISYLILSRKCKFCELIVPLSLPFRSL